MEIRLAEPKDLSQILAIYKLARQFMIDNGNPDQWGTEWPSDEIVKEDIKVGRSFVVIENEIVHAVFAFVIGVDKTYLNIYDGNWISNKEYGTIHRLASDFTKHGIFQFIMDYLEHNNKCNYRIDTHAKNKVMIKNILKNGYVYCGKINPIEGGERLAYEKVIY